MFKIFKMVGIAIGGVIVVIIMAVVVFLYTSPQFGGSHSPEDIARYKTSGNRITICDQITKNRNKNVSKTISEVSNSLFNLPSLVSLLIR